MISPEEKSVAKCREDGFVLGRPLSGLEDACVKYLRRIGMPDVELKGE